MQSWEEIKKSCDNAIKEAEGSSDNGEHPSSKEVDDGLTVPWGSFAQGTGQGGRRGNFANTTITANLLVIEAAVSMMVMVLLVIMVMVVVVVFLLVITVVVMVVVLLMFLSVVNFSLGSHLA